MLINQLNTGGKLLRTRFALTVAKHTSKPLDRVMPWAAACEVLHNASLVFDDIQDGDLIRRNAPTACALYGLESAINVGCSLMYLAPFLLAGLDIPVAIKWSLSSMMMQNTMLIIEGQQKDIAFRDQDRITLDEYYDCVEGKTSALIALCVWCRCIM